MLLSQLSTLASMDTTPAAREARLHEREATADRVMAAAEQVMAAARQREQVAREREAAAESAEVFAGKHGTASAPSAPRMPSPLAQRLIDRMVKRNVDWRKVRLSTRDPRTRPECLNFFGQQATTTDWRQWRVNEDDLARRDSVWPPSGVSAVGCSTGRSASTASAAAMPQRTAASRSAHADG